jgi:hypothetical protein
MIDIKNASTAIGIVITVGGLVWSAASQNAKIERNLETNQSQNVQIKELTGRIENVEKIYTKLDYIINSIDELKKKEEERIERDREMQRQQIKERDELISTLRTLRK